MKEAYDYLLNKCSFCDNDFLIVGVSGGPDSMALLHLLIELRKKININIVCAHVNHNVRKESEQEKKFVEKYCQNNNVIFEYMKIKKYGDENFHNEARNIRYKFFEDVMKKYNSKMLLTAHHGDDLMETILMRMVRGSTIKGYAGFSKDSTINGYRIIRPLIFCTKSEIEIYDKENKIPFVIDSSNEKDKYTRNRYRHNVLPFLKKEDSNVNKKFLKYSETLLEYSNYIDKIMLSDFDKIYKNDKLDIKLYLKKDNIIQKRIINYIFELIYSDDLSLINDSHFELVNKLIYGDKPNSSITLPNSIIVRREYDVLYFTNVSNDTSSLININSKILLENNIEFNNNRFIYVDNEQDNSNYVCRLNSKEISFPLYVRNKKDGDIIYVKGMLGKKKVKDIFINEKISTFDRNKWPIVVDSKDNIIWLPGLKKSKYNKEKLEKYDIIIKCVKEEEK